MDVMDSNRNILTGSLYLSLGAAAAAAAMANPANATGEYYFLVNILKAETVPRNAKKSKHSKPQQISKGV